MTEYREKPSFKIVFWSCLFGCMLLRGQVNKDIIRVQYHIKTIAFYNLENLFDTINQPHVYDDDRTPTGKDQWTSKKFHHKINQLARVVGSLGLELSYEKVSANGQKRNQNETRTPPRLKPLSYTSGADIIGVCEVENIAVLEALVQHPILQPFGYGIIHFDSPDERGIDVALLYKKKGFIPASFNNHSLYLYNDMQMRDYTRDQLVVMGYLDGEPIWLIINHWPSRSGGEARSKPHRLAAALLNVRIIDSIRNLDPKAKIIGMGDFNDNPTDESFKQLLQTKSRPSDSSYRALYNPMESLFKKGFGSLAYRDQWSLFDQFYLSETLLEKKEGVYSFLQAKIFTHPSLVTQKGRYRGYPFRSYSGGSYQGGYSDHFPIQLFLIKKTLTATDSMESY